MITGKTKSGFEFEISEDIKDDYEFFEIVSEAQENTGLFPKLITILLGKEQKKRLSEHCRGENGRISTSKMMEEIEEIFTQIKEIKN